MPTRSYPSHSFSSRRRQRGFTLIELLVAVLAGMIVTASAFAFARSSTNSFQQETRSAGATIAATLGFRRLATDLERVSFMSPPNIQRGYVNGGVFGSVCNQPSGASYPIGVRTLAGLLVERGGTYAPTDGQNHTDAVNNLAPDRITVAGSMSSTEQFPVRNIIVTPGVGAQIFLQPTSGAVVRTQGSATNPDPTPWTAIFAPGRIVRLVDQAGYQHFGVVRVAGLNGPGQPVISLQPNPALHMQGNAPPTAANPACAGIGGFGVGSLLNVVNRVRYEVRDLRNLGANNPYAAIYAAPGSGTAIPAEDAVGARWELVRYEIDADDQIMTTPETRELIAEYAVDLKVGVTVDTQAAGLTPPNPVLLRYDPGQALAYDWTGAVTALPGVIGPERVRSVQLRLMVRSRQADRSDPLAGPTLPSGVSGGLYRYRVPGTTRFARVRTLQADVALQNQFGGS